MYNYLSSTQFDGAQWHEDDIEHEHVADVLSKYPRIFITCKDPVTNKLAYLDKDDLLLVAGGLTIFNMLRTLTPTKALSKPLGLVKTGIKNVPLKKISSNRLSISGNHPVAIANDGAHKLIQKTNESILPGITEILLHAENPTLAVFEGMVDSTIVSYGSAELAKGLEQAFVKIGPVVIAARTILHLVSSSVVIKPNLDEWFYNLYHEAMIQIPPHEIGLSYPPKIDELRDAAIIVKILKHPETLFWVVKNKFPLSLDSMPISDNFNPLTSGVIYRRLTPTVNLIANLGYVNQHCVARKEVISTLPLSGELLIDSQELSTARVEQLTFLTALDSSGM